MKRPKIHPTSHNRNAYLASDIDPLLDELESLRGAQEFPTLQEFEEWYSHGGNGAFDIYDYFAQFKTRTIEVMPEVGKEYELSTNGKDWEIIPLSAFYVSGGYYYHIRPIATPTRDEVIKRAKELGLTDSEIEVLGGKS
jgi:hypothetical protein